MFEQIDILLAGWRTLLHLSEWSGLSIGVLAAIAVVIWLRPALLKPALLAAGLVAFGFSCVIYGDHAGRTDKQREWDAARVAAEAAAVRRDGEVAVTLEQTYLPRLKTLQAEADARKAQGDQYEAKILALIAAGQPKGAAPAACLLGAVAGRLHHGPSAR